MRKKLLCMGLLLSLTLMGCGLSTDKLAKQIETNLTKNAPATAAPKETPEENLPETETFSLGKKATLGDWKITAKNVSVKSQIKNGKFYVYKPEKGCKFVCVKVTVRNTGKKEATFLPRIGTTASYMAHLYYKDYEYKPTALLSYKQDLVGAKVEPLKSKTGILAFALPKKIANKTKKMTLKIGTNQETIEVELKK